MAPVDRCTFQDDAKNDLFSSLFGIRQQNNNQELKQKSATVTNDIRLI